jgi:hypothetical protein
VVDKEEAVGNIKVIVEEIIEEIIDQMMIQEEITHLKIKEVIIIQIIGIEKINNSLKKIISMIY